MKDKGKNRDDDKRPRTSEGLIYDSCRKCQMKAEECRGECLQSIAETEIRRKTE